MSLGRKILLLSTKLLFFNKKNNKKTILLTVGPGDDLGCRNWEEFRLGRANDDPVVGCRENGP